MKMKRVLSLLLALVMTMSLLTLPSYAEDEAAAEEVTPVEDVTPAEEAAPVEDVTPAEEVAPAEDVTPAEDGLEYGEVVIGAMASSIVDYTNVAPLEDAKAAAPVRKALKSALMQSGAANYVPVDPTPEKGKTADGLVLSKTATPNADGGYDIKLEAYTTGTVSTSTEAVPTDIILVLDQSGSMDNTYTSVTEAKYNTVSTTNNAILGLTRDLFIKLDNGDYARVEVNWFLGYYSYTWTDENGNEKRVGSYGSLLDCPSSIQGKLYQLKTSSTDVSRLEALKNSATDFINAVQKDADTNKVDHRIAVVGFASDDKNYNNNKWENTELLSTSNPVAYNNAKNTDYAAALVSANNDGAVNSRLTTAIGRLDAEGGTYINYGLDMAQKIFNNTDGTGRNRVVVVLTDGTPGNGTWGNTVTGNTCASDALSKATALKNADVVIYTVGIFDGADATSAGANSGTTAQKSNYFMQNMSSNNGVARDPSYYLSASDQTALKNIFEKISQEISTPTISLDSNAVVRDIVSPYFDMPANTSAVTVKTYDCTKYENEVPTWSPTGKTLSNAVNVDTKNNTIEVNGFDFNKNFVAENGRSETNPTQSGTFHGRKLEITFTVTPKDGFWGGNNVPTNGNQSGVYVGNEPIATFDVPTVNVPLYVPELKANDKNIYLLGDVPSASDLGTFAVPTEAWKTAYVNIGQITANKDISNTADTTTKLSVTVTPKYTGINADGTVQNSVTKEATATVNVFTPEVNFKDSTIYQGNTADYSVNMTDTPVWKHGTTVDSAVTMIGTKPTLSYTYDKAAAKFEDCTDVAVTVKIGTTAVTDKTTGDKQFTVHVLQPTITATVDDVEKYYGESYTLGTGANGSINVTWADKSTHSGIPAVSGQKPYDKDDLTLVYSTDAFTGKTGTVPAKDFDVTVKVMKGTQEMTDATITTSCTYGCGADQTDGVYTVHVKTCTLTVKKAGWDSKDANQSFIFNVSGAKSMQVTVQGNGEAKIVGLPVGDYTVTEDGNWSWRYTAQGDGSATLSADNHDATVTITNSRTNNKWLSGDSYAINTTAGANIH